MPKSEFLEQMKSVHAQVEQETAKLKAESEKIEEAEKEEKASQQKTLLDLILEECSDLTPQQINSWKDQFGAIYASRFDKGEIFIYRFLAYPEYKQIRQNIEKSTLPPAQLQELFDEMIVEKCVLYPSITPDFKMLVKAGTIGTLAEQIRIASNFLPDAVVYELINKI